MIEIKDSYEEMNPEEREDALFREIMKKTLDYEIAEAYKGIEEIERRGEQIVPDGADERILRAIREQQTESGGEPEYLPQTTSRHVRKLRPLKYLMTASVAVCMTIAVSISALAMSPDLRNMLWSVFTTTNEKATDFKLSYSENEESLASETSTELTDFEVSWLPQGFELINNTNFPDNYIAYKFSDKNDNTIEISRMTGDNSVLSIDTEDAVISEANINGQHATISENLDEAGKNQIIITWADKNDGTFYEVAAHGVSESEVLRVANNITDKEN